MQSGPRVDFYQLGDQACVSVFIKGCPTDAEITIKETEIVFPSFTLGPLFGKVDPSKSSYKIFGTKVELNLHKADRVPWTSVLRNQNDVFRDSEHEPAIGFEKNWDKLAREAEDDAAEQSTDVNRFFEQLYANADDNTKRAMMKSYTESNGTSLSTNWESVSQGKVEPQS